MTKKKIKEFMETAHPLPYGDKLCDLLSEFIMVFKEHTHNYNNLPTVKDPNYIEFVSKYGVDGKKFKRFNSN